MTVEVIVRFEVEVEEGRAGGSSGAVKIMVAGGQGARGRIAT